MDRFDADRIEAARTTIWNSGCKSWYLDANGVPTAWPWTFDRFREEMAAPRLGDFDMRMMRLLAPSTDAKDSLAEIPSRRSPDEH